ncbi:MAG: hypothetical protein ACRCZY_08660 [Phocaeicola sp.]
MKLTILLLRRYICMLACFMLIAFAGCKTEFAHEFMGNQIYFKLDLENSTLSRSRSLPSLQVRYQIADYTGTILQEIQSDYHADQTTIVIEPLPLGSYTLYVLAYDETLQAEGLHVNESIQNINELWFEFEGGKVPVLLKDQLYYSSTTFDVTTETVMHQSVKLRYVLAGVDVNRQISSLQLSNSLRHIGLDIDETVPFYTSMRVDGQYEGSGSVASCEHSFLTNHSYYLMPQQGEEAVATTFTVTTENHLGEQYQLDLVTQIPHKGGVKEEIKLDLSAHPDAQGGTLYITPSYYDQEDRALIFQDGEHHDLYCDSENRSFHMNQLLQLKGEENLTIHTRFYSVRPIRNFSVWSSSERYGERVLLAHYDSIPAFCDARFQWDDLGEGKQFLMESNEHVKLTSADLQALLNSKLEMECDDAYWKQLKQIIPGWKVWFHLYGADPTQPDGGPAGNWRGIRPVHIREAIAALTNMAYMFSAPGYPEHLESYQGQVWGNGGQEDIVDVTTIIPALFSRENFRVGLCGGVAGLGGGATFGVWQPAFFNHYNSTYYSGTYFHEFGHCIGYSHSSALCSGFWDRTITSAYYVANVHTFPVPSADILNSNNNPNRY